MLIHPQTRSVISSLSLPTPIKKYFSPGEWEVDLTNNTNPYMGYLAEYPDVKHVKLKEKYLSTILSINSPSLFSNKNFSTLSADHLLFTVGSMEGIDLILRTFAEPNKDVICIPHPSFSAYEHWTLLHNLSVHKLPLGGSELNSLSVKEIVKINPKIVFLCNPNNPTGTRLDHEIIEKLCQSLTGFIVIDEAYIEFSDDSSSIFYLNKYNNLIVLRTFSKAWGMAGVRCGAIIADHRVINALRHVQAPFAFSTPSQEKIRERLQNVEEVFLSWKRIKKNRNHLISTLSTLKNVGKIYKSHTNFIMIILNDFAKSMESLAKHKILVLDCSIDLSNAIRVSLGNEEQNRRFVTAMSE